MTTHLYLRVQGGTAYRCARCGALVTTGPGSVQTRQEPRTGPGACGRPGLVSGGRVRGSGAVDGLGVGAQAVLTAGSTPFHFQKEV